LPKKEVGKLEYEIMRLNRRLGGLKDMRRLPNLLFVVDVRREAIAIKEANILGIPIVAMVDTNCDPEPVDYVIPCNDDAIRAIRLLVSTMAEAVIEGDQIRESLLAEEEEVEAMGEEESLERYLGPSTLAKLRSTDYDEEEDEGKEDEAYRVAKRRHQRQPVDELSDEGDFEEDEDVYEYEEEEEEEIFGEVEGDEGEGEAEDLSIEGEQEEGSEEDESPTGEDQDQSESVDQEA